MPQPVETGARDLVDRLVQAVNDHDVDALTACFAVDYRNETPAHPARGFTGQGQVRRNWEQILAAVPDLRATVLRCAVEDDVVFTEWEHAGTRRDGSPHLMRGVVIFGVSSTAIVWSRFYLEPVETSSGDVDAAVARIAPTAP